MLITCRYTFLQFYPSTDFPIFTTKDYVVRIKVLKDFRSEQVSLSIETEYPRLCRQLTADSDRVRAAIERNDRDCWEGYLHLIMYRLHSRRPLRSEIVREIAAVVDPLIRAAAKSDAVACLRPLHMAGCVLGEVSDCYQAPCSLLHDAVLAGADRVIAWLLDQGICEIDPPADKGLTPLHTAARIGRLSTIEVLLARGAYVDSATHRGQTPLHFAVEHLQLAAAKQLLLAGANPGATTVAGETALTIAARVGPWDCVEILLEHGAPALSALPEILRGWGVDKLDHPRLAHLRLERCRRDELGSLFNSLDPDEARWLLKRGADPGCAAEHALRHHEYKLLSIIREYGRFPLTDAHYRAAAESRLGMEQLLDDGADPNTWVSKGRESRERVPIIYYAAIEWTTDLEVVPLLLDHGADLRRPPGSELRPLLCELLCRGRASVALTRALVERGASVNGRDSGGLSALHVVVGGFWSELSGQQLHTLIELGVEPNARDHHGRTAIMIAIGNPNRGAASRVQALLNAGADASCQDSDGMSALHYFFSSGERCSDEPASLTAAVELLIHAGADVNALDVRGKYADEVGDETLHREQRTCVRRVRLRRGWMSEHNVPQTAAAPLLRC